MSIERAVEYSGNIHYEIRELLLLIANRFRSVPFESPASLESTVESSKGKILHHFLAALRAIDKQDGVAFGKELAKGVVLHVRNYNSQMDKHGYCETAMISVLGSILWNIAEMRKLQVSPLSVEAMAGILTRESLGLEQDGKSLQYDLETTDETLPNGLRALGVYFDKAEIAFGAMILKERENVLPPAPHDLYLFCKLENLDAADRLYDNADPNRYLVIRKRLREAAQSGEPFIIVDIIAGLVLLCHQSPSVDASRSDSISYQNTPVSWRRPSMHFSRRNHLDVAQATIDRR